MAWTKVGTIRKSKNGGSYLKIEADVTLTKGSALNIQDPRAQIKNLIASGKLDEAKGQERLSKIPDYITREVFLMPEKDM
jgi:hypothetical protein